MSIPSFPKLTQEMYDEKDLTGIFITDKKGVRFNKCDSRFTMWGPDTIVFLKDGILHNEEGPAIISTDKSSFKRYRECTYFVNGKLHREGAPASIQYKEDLIWSGTQFIPDFRDSKVLEYCYYHNDLKHNLAGPAEYSAFDKKKYSYYINGREYLKRDFVIEPEVIFLNQKLRLKEKMNKEFKDIS